MTIDVKSLIIGGVLWELISAYIYFVIKPRIRKFKEDQKQSKDDAKNHKQERYKETNMGFTEESK